MVQSNPTESTNNKIKMLLDYLATYPNAKIRYHASDMVLHVDSDTAYLVLPKARSRIAGYFYLSKECLNTITKSPIINGSVLVECKVLKHVVSSAAEAETGGLFHNCQTAIMIRHILNALGHHQKPTPVKSDNSTAASFVNDLLKQKRSKSWDMRFHWLRENKNFIIYWDRGTNNDADYFTKHHAPRHHKTMRPKYILQGFLAKWSKQSEFLQEMCARVY